MKPNVLATAERPPVASGPHTLRYRRVEAACIGDKATPGAARLLALLPVLLIPLLAGRWVALELDQPMLGIVAGALLLIPMITGLSPREGNQPRGGRPRR